MDNLYYNIHYENVNIMQNFQYEMKIHRRNLLQSKIRIQIDIKAIAFN